MTKKAFEKLPLGLYRVHWKSGGVSVAAIGNSENGTRWLAPCNWINVGPILDKHYKAIKEMELVCIK